MYVSVISTSIKSVSFVSRSRASRSDEVSLREGVVVVEDGLAGFLLLVPVTASWLLRLLVGSVLLLVSVAATAPSVALHIITPASLLVATVASVAALPTISIVVAAIVPSPRSLICCFLAIDYFDFVVALLPVEGHQSLYLLHCALRFRTDLVVPQVLQVGVGGFFEQGLVSREFGPAFDLLQLALDSQRVTQRHQKLIRVRKLIELSGWRNLELAKLLDVGVVKVDAVLVLVVEVARAVAIALLLTLVALQSVHLVAGFALCL